MKKVFGLMLVIAMFVTSTVYASSWSGSNSVTIVEPQKVEILPNGDFSVSQFTSSTTPYGNDGYRGYTHGLTNNIKGLSHTDGKYATLPVETVGNQKALKLELNDTAEANATSSLRFAVGLFHMTDATRFRTDHDFGEYNRTLDMNAPVYKNDKAITVKFDVYKPTNSSLNKLNLFIRTGLPGDNYNTKATYNAAVKNDETVKDSVKQSIISKSAADLTADTFVTVEKTFKFSDYEILKKVLDAGHYAAFEINPVFADTTNPVVYIANYSISYYTDGVYQTPDTNMISSVTISDAYKNSGWITEDTTVTYNNGDKSYKFVPHKGYPRYKDYAVFNSNFYNDLKMTLGEQYAFNSEHTYRFSCMVKADATATKLSGAQLRICKNSVANDFLGMTNAIVTDGEWHELIYDFSGDASLKNFTIGIWKHSREAFADYNEDTGAITGGDEVTFYLAEPTISVLPVYLEMDFVKKNDTTTALVIQNLSPNDVIFSGTVIVAEYETKDGVEKLVKVSKSEVDEKLEAYEGRSATRAKLENVAAGNKIRAFLWKDYNTLTPLLTSIAETVETTD